MDLRKFIQKIPEFRSLTSSSQIEYFVYFLIFEKNVEGIQAKDVASCFDELLLSPYSNISAYLSKHSQRGKGQKFLKKRDLYFLENSTKSAIDGVTNKEFEPEPSNNLFPLSIFDNTRGYLIAFAKEASCAYDYSLYNSCFFMLRKIIETLIVDLFERHGIESKIKNSQGNYIMLSDLFTRLISENKWQLNKTVKQDIPKIKKLADSSVHSKRFQAKKPDLDNIKIELRIIFQELVDHIDYPSWKNK
jgi:hypothetical protein